MLPRRVLPSPVSLLGDVEEMRRRVPLFPLWFERNGGHFAQSVPLSQHPFHCWTQGAHRPLLSSPYRITLESERFLSPGDIPVSLLEVRNNGDIPVRVLRGLGLI